MRKSRELQKLGKEKDQAQIKLTDKSTLSKSEQSKMRMRKSRKLRKLQKENCQAEIKPNDRSGKLTEKEERLQNKRKLRAQLRNQK